MKQVTIKTASIALTVLDYGAIIQKILVKDRKGKTLNMVVGFENPSDYFMDNTFLGACVGRFAGRISNCSFALDGEIFPLHGENGVHLHGGKEGFGKKHWLIKEVNHGRDPFVKLSHESRHMEEGYPGNLKVVLTYRLIGNELHIEHLATTDKKTVLNLTNHSYFKLDAESGIDHYMLLLNARQLLEMKDNLLPTGNIISVKDTPKDFSSIKRIGGVRLDTPFVLASGTDHAATLYSDMSGISLKVTTNQPGMVVYTPPHFAGICFEAQNFPDAPNNPSFPSSVLLPGETYNNTAVFKFDLVN